MDKGSTSSQLVIGNGAAKAPVTKFNVCTGRPPRCSPGVQTLRENEGKGTLRENEALKAQLRERDKDLEEMEKKLWEKDEEILSLNVLLGMKFIRNYTITTKIHNIANMDLVVGEEDMLIHSLEGTLEGTKTTRSQQNTHYDNNSAVQALKEENKVLEAKLTELKKNLERRKKTILKKEDEVRSIKARITEEATRNCRTEEELRNFLEDFSSLKVQRSDVQINESEEVGRGAYGRVMKGKFCGLEVVVKEPLDTSSEALENFKRESDIISRLYHPNVVRCLATVDGCEEQPPLIVLESADDGSLEKRLSKGPLHPLEAFSFAVDAGRALLYLHSLPCPILHGDLHFANFLLFQRGFPSRLKLCDFGDANTISPNQGTPNFNANSFPDEVYGFKQLLSSMLRKIKWPDRIDSQTQQLIGRIQQKLESRSNILELVNELTEVKKFLRYYYVTETSFNRH